MRRMPSGTDSFALKRYGMAPVALESAYECPSCAAVGAKPLVSPPYSLSASALRSMSSSAVMIDADDDTFAACPTFPSVGSACLHGHAPFNRTRQNAFAVSLILAFEKV